MVVPASVLTPIMKPSTSSDEGKEFDDSRYLPSRQQRQCRRSNGGDGEARVQHLIYCPCSLPLPSLAILFQC